LGSGNEIGPFRAIEESVVAHLTTSGSRSDVYAWYSLLGTAGTAFGMMTCGWVMNRFITELGWEIADAYRTVFIGYAAMGLIKLLLVCMLSKQVEVEKEDKLVAPDQTETTPLLGDAAVASVHAPSKKGKGLRALLPEISHESRGIMVSLCLLFGLDSFASGFVSLYVPPTPFTLSTSLTTTQLLDNLLLPLPLLPPRRNPRLHLLHNLHHRRR
jgi:MFS family permease